LQHGDLVAQDEYLGVLIVITDREQADQRERVCDT
jgi:hypothetical protein